MLTQEAVPIIEVGMLLGPVLSVVQLLVPLVAVLAALRLLMVPLPGRGPRGRKRDPWRGFRFVTRKDVLARAGHRCESSTFLAWGRCSQPAAEVDHIYPWSKGGPTIASNGQALCTSHNRSKSSMTPPWWYVMGLERRRLDYFPADTPFRVSALMSDDDRALRQAWIERKRKSLEEAAIPLMRSNHGSNAQ